MENFSKLSTLFKSYGTELFCNIFPSYEATVNTNCYPERSVFTAHIGGKINSSFSQTKVGKVDIIANFVFLCISSFPLCLTQQMPVNVKLEIKGYLRITYWVS